MPKTTKFNRPIKLLVYGDSPVVPSGFATVIKNVFTELGRSGKYDIDILGINDRGNWKDPKVHPYRVYQVMPPGEIDPYGRSRFIDIVRGGGTDLEPPWDLIFLLNDPFVLEAPIPYFKIGTLSALRDIQKTHYLNLPPESWFKTIGYFPVDSPVKPQWVQYSLNLVDVPVAYTQYGKTEILKADKQLDEPTGIKPQVIPHGNNFTDFYPLEKTVVAKFKHDFFGSAVRDDTFIVTVVGRNQVRKDIPRAMKIFKEFQKRRPDSYLYVHSQEEETWGSLEEVALQLHLKQGQDWNYPKDFVAHKGFPINVLNAIYNASNVCLTATQGEGWGLPLTEAMAAKTINLAPAHTSIPELFNLPSTTSTTLPTSTTSLRGLTYKSGSTLSEWINHGAEDMERFRPLGNVDDAVQKIIWIYDQPDEVKQIETNAYEWIKKLTWKKVAKMWDELFTKTYLELESERNQPDNLRKQWSKTIVPARKLM